LTGSPSTKFSGDIRTRLKRAEKRMDRSESDAEYEGNRQVVIYLRALIETADRAAA
jgi:hypothetical protein